MKLLWLGSYETIKFDTTDGDLHKDQYAVNGGVYYVRTKSQNEDQWDALNPEDHKQAEIDALIAGKTLVNILPGETMYYDEYLLDDKTKYRVATTKTKYKDLEKKDAKPLELNVTQKEIDDIKASKLTK